MLSVNELNDFKSQGFLKFVKLFDQKVIDDWNISIDKLSLIKSDTSFDENKTGKIKQIQYLHQKDNTFQELVDALYPIATILTNCNDLSVLNVQLFEKHPSISKPTRSHQDNAYFKILPANAVTFWVALDEIDEENGCLYYAPKTHLTPTRKHQRYHEHTTFRVRSGVPGLSLCLKEHPEETDIAMLAKSGDVFVHHCNLVHRAGANNSIDRRRRAIGVVFLPNESKVDPRLVSYHEHQLQEDIELQKIKDPTLYAKLREEFDYLF